MSYSNEIVQEENPYLLIFLIALALSILLVSIIFYFWSFRLKYYSFPSDCVSKKSSEMCKYNNSSTNSLASSVVLESSENESLIRNSPISYESKSEYENFACKMLKSDKNRHKSATLISNKDKDLLSKSKNMNSSKIENNGLKKKCYEKRKSNWTKNVNANKKKLKIKSHKKINSLELSSLDYGSTESSGEYFDQRMLKNVRGNFLTAINDKNTIKCHRMQHHGLGIRQNFQHPNHFDHQSNTMSSLNNDLKQNLHYKQVNNIKHNHCDYYSSENVFPQTSNFISFDNSLNDSTKHMSKPILRDQPEHFIKPTESLSHSIPSNLSNTINPTDKTIPKTTLQLHNDSKTKESEDRIQFNSSNNFHSSSNVKNYQVPQIQFISGFYPYSGVATNMLPNLPIFMYPIGIYPIPIDPWPFTSTISNIPKTSSSEIPQDLKIGRHGAPLKISIREHQKMMNELHMKALERIGRMEPANKEHYKLG